MKDLRIAEIAAGELNQTQLGAVRLGVEKDMRPVVRPGEMSDDSSACPAVCHRHGRSGGAFQC
jgi:hypothetical protein